LACYSTTVSQAFASTPSFTPDDDVFHHLAGLYAQHHPSMHLGLPCKPGSPSFPNGTTNGAAWYPLTGGAQDYSYVWAGTMEITIEMACCKYPPAAELPVHWNEHRQVLFLKKHLPLYLVYLISYDDVKSSSASDTLHG